MQGFWLILHDTRQNAANLVIVCNTDVTNNQNMLKHDLYICCKANFELSCRFRLFYEILKRCTFYVKSINLAIFGLNAQKYLYLSII